MTVAVQTKLNASEITSVSLSRNVPTISEFLLAHGRLPHVCDAVKPWRFQGWLVPYLQKSEQTGGVAARYDYVLRTIENGELLNEPIPQIEFESEFDACVKPGLKMFNALLDHLNRQSGGRILMPEFCRWLAFATGVVDEASDISDDLQEYLYRNFDYRTVMHFPSDYLGQLLCESAYGKRRGFYPTPIDLCRLNWMITKGGVTGIQDNAAMDLRRRSAYDPAVGTGRLLLIASNDCLRLYGQEIDYLCCLITKINLAFYAPWSAIPASFFD